MTEQSEREAIVPAMTDKPEAVACPFCGGQPTMQELHWRGGDARGEEPFCRSCGAKVPRHWPKREKNAIAAWNTRATPAQPDASALVEALRQSQRVFAEYAELHRRKLGQTLDSFQHRDIIAKVERNRDMSDMCLAALKAWEQSNAGL